MHRASRDRSPPIIIDERRQAAVRIRHPQTRLTPPPGPGGGGSLGRQTRIVFGSKSMGMALPISLDELLRRAFPTPKEAWEPMGTPFPLVRTFITGCPRGRRILSGYICLSRPFGELRSIRFAVLAALEKDVHLQEVLVTHSSTDLVISRADVEDSVFRWKELGMDIRLGLRRNALHEILPILHFTATSSGALCIRLAKLIKLTNQMVDAGKMYVSQQRSFIKGLWDLSAFFTGDSEAVGVISKLSRDLHEIVNFQTILLDQASRSDEVGSCSQVKPMKEMKNYFEKFSGELDTVLQKNSQAPRNKLSECEETKDMLRATRSGFMHASLEYVQQLSLLQAAKRHEIISCILSYAKGYVTFFNQGADITTDLDPYLKSLSKQWLVDYCYSGLTDYYYRVTDTMCLPAHGDMVLGWKEDQGDLRRILENQHQVANDPSATFTLYQDEEDKSIIASYLFKKPSRNTFRKWNRRWFILRNSQLVYMKRTGEPTATVMEEDLKLCTVKPAADADRRYCFEIHSPMSSHVLQADSEEMYNAWVTALQTAINEALHSSFQGTGDDGLGGTQAQDSPGTLSSSSISFRENVTSRGMPGKSPARGAKSMGVPQLMRVPGNELCADCRTPDPKWASINIGVTLCIECSGIHRSLGVHHSKVRSLFLDAWEPEVVKVFGELGNTIVNRVYEACVDETIASRPTANSDRGTREAWIKAKYVEKAFVSRTILESPRVTPSPDAGERPPSAPPRRWSVKKSRQIRRPRSGERGMTALRARGSRSLDLGRHPLPDLCLEVQATVNSARSSEDVFGEGGEKKAEVGKGEEIIVIGEEIPEGHPIALDSEDCSTEGEDDSPVVGGEDMSKLDANHLLFRAAKAHNLPVMCQALALSADKDWCNHEDRNLTPLHMAVLSGSTMACEYLLLNGAKCNVQDADGKTPLHLAVERGYLLQVCLLLQRHRAESTITDNQGLKPIDIAIKSEDGDIVTVLRMAALDAQMRSEADYVGEDTLEVFVRDFTERASTDPKRMSKLKLTKTPEQHLPRP
ncbi:unnamed protein product [Darwinula stevensoni]|uniref:Arf-GAP with coiled-coil, ANK repeat and PH domain-containing protein 2 n=1 Tax=Darwinula stevensoni TaxID=69355 RepID=A0A7R9A6A2_9CRUS|nr:unnamed protein product [Darwinula stevensoni]CAG0887159.1 unnamed protein product [Darwinula stevensoni]